MLCQFVMLFMSGDKSNIPAVLSKEAISEQKAGRWDNRVVFLNNKSNLCDVLLCNTVRDMLIILKAHGA